MAFLGSRAAIEMLRYNLRGLPSSGRSLATGSRQHGVSAFSHNSAGIRMNIEIGKIAPSPRYTYRQQLAAACCPGAFAPKKS